MKDKILGPLTLVQLVYAVIGFGAAYSAFKTLPSPVGEVVAVPIVLFTIGVCFVKINERPFLDFMLSFLEFTLGPKQRVWHHQSFNDMRVVIYRPDHKNDSQVKTKVVTHEQIVTAAKKIDTPGENKAK